MRLIVHCRECVMAGGAEHGEVPCWIELQDDNAYVEKCPQGHAISFTINNPRYEILYESGIVAFLFGFHREAVSSIAAALERFFEFTIRAMLSHQQVQPAAVEEAWKLVDNQSERQLGAFQFLYLACMQEPFREGKLRTTFEEWTKFRNKVIHKGALPERSKVRQYAEYVFDLTKHIWLRIDARASSVLKEVRDQLIARDRAIVEKRLASTCLQMAGSTGTG
jgi:hypothetical protein